MNICAANYELPHTCVIKSSKLLIYMLPEPVTSSQRLAHIIDLQNKISSFGNRNKDFTQSEIYSANQAYALFIYAEVAGSGNSKILISCS